MFKIICDECGERVATLHVFGGNPVPTHNKLSNVSSNGGYSLCETCRVVDPAEWKNIVFNLQYVEAVRRSTGFVKCTILRRSFETR